jgi:hypothetical protein
LHLSAPEHGGNELAHLIGGGLRLTSRGGLRLLLRVARADLAFDQVERVDAQRPADEAEHDQGADPDAAGAAHRHPAGPIGAPILDVVAARQFIPAHGSSPLRSCNLYINQEFHSRCRVGERITSSAVVPIGIPSNGGRGTTGVRIGRIWRVGLFRQRRRRPVTCRRR